MAGRLPRRGAMQEGRRRFLAALGLAALATPAAAAGAPTPTERVRSSIQRVLRVLDDPGLRDADGAQRRAMIRRAAAELFDFTAMARRAVGPRWQALTPGDREELAGLMQHVLERAYLARIERYAGEIIRFTGERRRGDAAIVQTRIVTAPGRQIPVDYWMVRRGRWLAYDVTVAGVSLVAAASASYRALLQRLLPGWEPGDELPAGHRQNPDALP